MKRMVSMFLTLTMLLGLAGCGGGTEEKTEDTGASSSPELSATQPDESKAQPVSDDRLPGFGRTAEIQETVMVDESDVRIIATGLTYSNYAAELEVTIENNSTQNLSFVSGSLGYSCNSVNGMMVPDGYLNCDVAAGKKAVDTIAFSYNTLQLCGIREIADIEVGFYITDESYRSTYFAPRQITTSIYDGYEYDSLSYQETITSAAAQNTLDYQLEFFAADRLYEQEEGTVLSQALVKNAEGEQSLFVEVENRSEEMRVFSVGDLSVNGMLVSAGLWSSETVAPGKRAIISMALSSVLDERSRTLLGIEKIGSVSFRLQQTDLDWNEIAGAQKVTVDLPAEDTVDVTGTELYNQNGVRVIEKAILDPAEYDLYCHVLLLAENTGSGAVELEIPHNVLSVNGFMVDYFGSKWEVQEGRYTLMDLEVSQNNLENINVTGADQIEQAEFELEISRDGSKLDTTTLRLGEN